MPLTEKQLLARDAKRNMATELLVPVRQMTAGSGKTFLHIDTSATGEPLVGN